MFNIIMSIISVVCIIAPFFFAKSYTRISVQQEGYNRGKWAEGYKGKTRRVTQEEERKANDTPREKRNKRICPSKFGHGRSKTGPAVRLEECECLTADSPNVRLEQLEPLSGHSQPPPTTKVTKSGQHPRSTGQSLLSILGPGDASSKAKHLVETGTDFLYASASPVSDANENQIEAVFGISLDV